MTIIQAHSRHAGDGWLRPALSAGLLALAGLLAALDASAAGGRTVTSENAGVVCFWRGHTGSGAEARFRPALGCRSSSCTTPLEQSFAAAVRGGATPEIAMTSRFVVLDTSEGRVCTADCGGSGEATSTLTHLPAGIWRLTLGGREIGRLDTERLKGDPFNRICFGSER